MKIIGPQTISNVTTGQDLQRFLSQTLSAMLSAFNGQITFTENINCAIVPVTFDAANKTVAVPHKLNRIASLYLVASMSNDLRVFDSKTANTSDTLYVQSTAAGSVNLVVF